MRTPTRNRVTAILAIHGCAVGMGDASRRRYIGMLLKTSSDMGGTIAHVTLSAFVHCFTFWSPWCIRSTVKYSASEDISCCLSSPFIRFQESSSTLPLSAAPGCSTSPLTNAADLLLLWMHLCRKPPTVLCMSKRQTLGKLWTQFSRVYPQVMSENISTDYNEYNESIMHWNNNNEITCS